MAKKCIEYYYKFSNFFKNIDKNVKMYDQIVGSEAKYSKFITH